MIGSKKIGEIEVDKRWDCIDTNDPNLSIAHQCRLLELNRSSYYAKPGAEVAYNLFLMNLIDQEHTKYPFYGSRRIMASLRLKGHLVNRKRVQGLTRKMGSLRIPEDIMHWLMRHNSQKLYELLPDQWAKTR